MKVFLIALTWLIVFPSELFAQESLTLTPSQQQHYSNEARTNSSRTNYRYSSSPDRNIDTHRVSPQYKRPEPSDTYKPILPPSHGANQYQYRPQQPEYQKLFQ
jgi:hypothetical protein